MVVKGIQDGLTRDPGWEWRDCGEESLGHLDVRLISVRICCLPVMVVGVRCRVLRMVGRISFNQAMVLTMRGE
jgi:hypothetical protein